MRKVPFWKTSSTAQFAPDSQTVGQKLTGPIVSSSGNNCEGDRKAEEPAFRGRQIIRENNFEIQHATSSKDILSNSTEELKDLEGTNTL